MKRIALVLLLLTLVLSIPVGLAEFTENEPATDAPAQSKTLNLGITEDPTPTQAPPPVAQAGGSMMVAPGDAVAQDGATPDAGVDPAADAAQPPLADGEVPEYGKTNKKGVNIRARANAKGKSVARIGVTGTVFKITEVVANGNEIWYGVVYGNKEGYIRSDLVDIIEEQEFTAGQKAQRKSTGSSSSSSSSGSSSNNSQYVDDSSSSSPSGVPLQPGVHIYDGCAECLAADSLG